MRDTVFTIGHSNTSFEDFRALLQKYRIEAIADVRSVPVSKFSPHFSRAALKEALNQCGVRYAFLGAELGARTKDPACYRGGKVRYELLARTALFRAGIERLVRGSTNFNVAVMCAEKDPILCHRAILVGRYLHEAGINVRHILGSSAEENQTELVLRLSKTLGLPQDGLFRGTRELASMAYEMQGERIGYTPAAQNEDTKAGTR